MSPPPPDQVSASVGTEIESPGAESPPEGSDVNGNINADVPKRSAWNRPSNDVVEACSVMGGAASWPALSEAIRHVPRSSSESARAISDGSATSSQAPPISQSSQRQTNTNSHHNSANNHPRTRSRNRGGGVGGGGGGGSSGGGPSHSTISRPVAPAPPPFPAFGVPFGIVPPVLDAPMAGSRPIRNVGVSQSHVGSDHSSNRSTSRRPTYGPRPRSDGQHHNNQGGRRDQDRRDVVQPQYIPPHMGFMPSPIPPAAVPFMPQPVRVFPGSLGDMTPPLMYVSPMPPEAFRGMPIVPPPPPIMSPVTSMIIKQIDYYFSDDNLVKDNFLRKNMDDHGWVAITLIAAFPRVQNLTRDIPMILESLRYSTIVEVQGDKLRRRNEWKKWLLSSVPNSNNIGVASENALSTSFQEVSLNDSKTTMNHTMSPKEGQSTFRPPTDGSSPQSRFSNGDTIEAGYVIV